MSYQPCTIEGTGGFSKLNAPATISGAVACLSGACWVRFIGPAATTVTASGTNASITDPDQEGFTDGWARITAGSSLPFGTERVADTTFPDPVGQIDVFCDEDSVVTINQH